MKKVEEIISGAGGAQLYTEKYEAENPVGRMLIIHGYGEYSGRYRHVVEHLFRRKWSCYLLDLRGHGRSTGERGHVMHWSDYFDDLDAFCKRFLSDPAGPPIWVLGHSMGGLIASGWILERRPKVRGLILSSPYFGLKVKVNPVKVALGKALSRVWPRLSLRGEVQAALLTHQAEVVKEYEEDPLVHKVANARWFTESVEAQRRCLAQASKLDVPYLLMMQGGDDQIADPAAGKKFFEKTTVADKHYVSFDGFYHEIFNEVDRGLVFKELDRRLSERSA